MDNEAWNCIYCTVFLPYMKGEEFKTQINCSNTYTLVYRTEMNFG